MIRDSACFTTALTFVDISIPATLLLDPSSGGDDAGREGTCHFSSNLTARVEIRLPAPTTL